MVVYLFQILSITFNTSYMVPQVNKLDHVIILFRLFILVQVL